MPTDKKGEKKQTDKKTADKKQAEQKQTEKKPVEQKKEKKHHKKSKKSSRAKEDDPNVKTLLKEIGELCDWMANRTDIVDPKIFDQPLALNNVIPKESVGQTVTMEGSTRTKAMPVDRLSTTSIDCLLGHILELLKLVPEKEVIELLKKEITWPSGHQAWDNAIGNIHVEPLKVTEVKTLKDLQDVIVDAESKQLGVKAVGSGHSFSTIATTTDILVTNKQMNKVLGKYVPVKKGIKNDKLIEVESGITIEGLVKSLEKQKLAISNMGGYWGQTLAGALSTATHGSGIKFGPLCDMVQSLVLVTCGGVTLRLEPTNGITDPKKAGKDGIKLIQDDTKFYAAVASMGCTGLIYSYVIETVDFYFLKEVKEMTTWEDAQSHIESWVEQYDHFELWINPYSNDQGKHEAIKVMRQKVSDTKKSGGRNPFLWFGNLKISIEILIVVLNLIPQLTPKSITSAMSLLPTENYTDAYYNIYLLGVSGSDNIGMAAEIGFPMDKYKEAINAQLMYAQNAADIGQQYQASPFSLRFVKGSNAFLSPQHGRNTAMLELDSLSGLFGWKEIQQRYTTHMYQFGGRPHFGLNFGCLNYFLLKDLYGDALDKWLEVFQEFNSKGTFNNVFTDELGFSLHGLSSTH